MYVLENLYPRKPVAAVPPAEDRRTASSPGLNGSAPEVELELGEHWAAIRRARSAERSSYAGDERPRRHLAARPRGWRAGPPFLLRWEVLVSLIVLTVLWIPLGRYQSAAACR